MISKAQCFLEAKKSLSSKTDGWRVEVTKVSENPELTTPGRWGSSEQVEAGVGKGVVLPKTWAPRDRLEGLSQARVCFTGVRMARPRLKAPCSVPGGGQLADWPFREEGGQGPPLRELEPGFPQRHQPLLLPPSRTVCEKPTYHPFPLPPRRPAQQPALPTGPPW